MLTQNYFVLFDLPQSFEMDMNALASQYRQLQKRVHPDKFAGHTDQEQRLAVQFAAYVNQAYDCLRSPLKRAVYLLQLQGLHTSFDQMTVEDNAFLSQQMILREELMDLRGSDNAEAALERLKNKVEDLCRHIQQQLATDFSQLQFASAQRQVAKLHFVTKLLADIHQYEDQLFDER